MQSTGTKAEFRAYPFTLTSFGACDTAALRFLLPALAIRAIFSSSESLILPLLLVGANASGSVALAAGI